MKSINAFLPATLMVMITVLIVGSASTSKAANLDYSLPGVDNFNTLLSGPLSEADASSHGRYILKRVVLDAGHGGKDHGCSGKSSHEKDVSLDITLRLGQMIKNHYPDVQVIYTRDKDEFIPLHERAEKANKNRADLFISIHCNTTRKSNVKGSETFVMGLHRAADNLEVAKRENASIMHETDYQSHYDGFDPNTDEGHIMLNMYQNAYLDQSILFANMIEEEFEDHANRSSRGVKQAGFLVLRNTVMPSVLIETGFLSNNKEENYLTSETGKGKIASSIFNAFSKYKYDIEQSGFVIEHDQVEAMPASYNDKIMEETSVEVKPTTVQMDRPGPSNTPQTQHVSTTTTKQSVEKVVARSKKLEYVVQVAASPNKLKLGGGKWDRVKDVMIRFEKDMYKYQIGSTQTYEKALEMRTKLREFGFKDCFVAAYYDGDQINIKEAIQLSQ
ncbi:MAG: N-acetylmuramoyl-L-alanine amidase [Saprospiraceae bacterium]|nr:N-acetylmuramoyl-L-alanine amidase [Saprospiraceae bacterium]